jgi:pyrroline-5-carboxylate reductase
MPELKQWMRDGTLLVSIAAGITAPWIKRAVGFDCKLILAMPNTPLLLGQGAVALSRVEPAAVEEFLRVKSLFESVGIAEEIPPALMNEVIPVNGSSPAFVYLFAKTIIDKAAEAGIDEAAARNLVAQTLIGSAHMLRDAGKTPQELIDMVCSPGGTTLAAMAELERLGFTEALGAAFDACVRRAKELSGI